MKLDIAAIENLKSQRKTLSPDLQIAIDLIEKRLEDLNAIAQFHMDRLDAEIAASECDVGKFLKRAGQSFGDIGG